MMRYLLLILFVAGSVSAAGAAEASSFAAAGPRGQTAGGNLSNVDTGWLNTRTSSEFSYARNITVGRDAEGNLLVAVSYALRTAGEHTLAGQFSQAASSLHSASSHGQLAVTGAKHSAQVAGGVWRVNDDLQTRLQAVGQALGGSVQAWSENSSRR